MQEGNPSFWQEKIVIKLKSLLSFKKKFTYWPNESDTKNVQLYNSEKIKCFTILSISGDGAPPAFWEEKLQSNYQGFICINSLTIHHHMI